MKIKVYVVDVKLPRWLRRTLVFGGVPVVILGLCALVYAALPVPVPTFTDGTVLNADPLNQLSQDITNLDTRLAAVETGMSSSPLGIIQMYGGASAPANWVLCDGASYLQAGTYARLFAVIGTAFGSADGSHFNVPDLRGIFPKGAGTTNRSAGKDASGNSYAATLGTYAQDQVQGHIHDEIYSSGQQLALNGAAGTGVFLLPWSQVSNNTSNLSTGIPTTDYSNGTPRTGHTTEPQSVGLTFIIRAY